MPAAGKSYHGRRLAVRLGVPFVDGDEEIERAEGGGATLAEILARRGTEGFRRLESRVLCSVDCSEPVVIAPGGSAVYCPEALSRFRGLGAVLVHLRETEATVRERIGDPVARGVVMAPGMTFSGLFEERVRLCDEWADVTLDCAREADVVGALEQMLCAKASRGVRRAGAQERPDYPRDLCGNERAENEVGGEHVGDPSAR